MHSQPLYVRTWLVYVVYYYFENSRQIFVGKITSVRKEPKKQQSSKHQYFGGFLFLSLLQVGVCCCTVKECLVTHTHSIKETHLPETLTYGKVKQHSFPCQKSDQRGSQERGWIGNGIMPSSKVNVIRATWKVNLSITLSPFSWPPLNGNYLYKSFYTTSVQLLVLLSKPGVEVIKLAYFWAYWATTSVSSISISFDSAISFLSFDILFYKLIFF